MNPSFKGTVMKNFTFESMICTRCNGTGEHSFNLLHGSRCYGCSGNGNHLTKKGAAAQLYYNALCSKPASEFTIGELINVGTTKVQFATITHIESDNTGRINIQTAQITLSVYSHTVIKFGLSAEQKAEFISKALEYQSKLTKTGILPKKYQ